MRRVALLLLLAAAPLEAQNDSALRAAMDLAAAGRADSARVLLRRIVIEQSNAPWADDALLQLTHLALASGQPAAALDYVARLRLDYPGSELRPRAALLGGRAAIEAGDPRAGCALLDSSLAEAAGDIELGNQVLFHRARCGALLAAAPPSAPDTARGAAAPAPAPAGFEVQVAAARTENDARRVAQRFETAGYQVRIVRGTDNLFRVRVGPYGTREHADAAARAARTLAGGTPFVVRTP